jgi:hypothetical protein
MLHQRLTQKRRPPADNINNTITVYVLMSLVALLSLFIDSVAKGGDLVPEAEEASNGLSYQAINDGLVVKA